MRKLKNIQKCKWRFAKACLSLALIGTVGILSQGGAITVYADNNTGLSVNTTHDPSANLVFKNENLNGMTLDQMSSTLKIMKETVENNELLKTKWDELGKGTNLGWGKSLDISMFGNWKAVNNGKFHIVRKTNKDVFPLEVINSTIDDTVWLQEQALYRDSEYIMLLSGTRTRENKDQKAYDGSDYKYDQEGAQVAKELAGYDGIEKTFKAYSPEHGSRVKVSFRIGYTGDIDGSKANYKVEVFSIKDGAETKIYDTVIDPTKDVNNDKMTVTKATDGTCTQKILISNTPNNPNKNTIRTGYIGDEAAIELMAKPENKPNGKSGLFTSSEIELEKGVTEYKVRISLADKNRTGMSYQSWGVKYSLPMFGDGFSITQDTAGVAKHVFTKIYDKLIENKPIDTQKKTDASVEVYNQALTKMKELIDSAELKSKKDYVDALKVAEEAKKNLESTEQQAIDALTKVADNKIDTLNQNKDLSENERQTAIKRVNDEKDAAINNIRKATDNAGVDQAKENGIAEIGKINPVAKDNAIAAINKALSEKENEIEGKNDLTKVEKDKFKKEAKTIADRYISEITKKPSSEDTAEKATQSQKAINKAKDDAIAEIGKINPVAKANKSELEKAIKAATEAKKDIKTSADGKDVDPQNKWTTADEKKALEDAILEAKKVNEDENAKQEAVDAQKDKLEKAIEKFKKSLRNGLKESKANKSELEKAIKAATEAKKDIKTSTDGKDVDPQNKWTTADEKKALEDAILEAKKVNEDENAKQEAVDAQKDKLEKAIEKFKKSLRNGLKESKANKSELEKAIKAATEAKKDIKTSTDGKDVDPQNKWATADEMKALEDAILEAKKVNEDKNAKQADVDAQKDKLEKAIEKFQKSLRDGLKEPKEPGKPGSKDPAKPSNNPKKPVVNIKVPQTGDSSNVGIFTGLLALSGGALAILITLRKRKMREEN
ncbi:DUF1542 domain-containing protein [Parvimonas parva]|uniref:DUF1542 domain-containing protein n=1 Tax=Parvimonas parva TaxID=2769485 RepID=A0ABS1C9J6_9FIRM|nr:DUF1542 domain-containing protein [Parvimonas parva]MBK1468772.1 DUF1542 domain-containing protein [Parvimonas parva]